MENVPCSYPPSPLQVHLKFSNEFLCNFPSAGNVEYIHSVPGHVTKMSRLGKPWEHLKFPKECTWDVPEWLIHNSSMVFPLGVITVFQISKTQKKPEWSAGIIPNWHI